MHMCIRSAQILAKYNIRMNVKHSGLLEHSIESPKTPAETNACKCFQHHRDRRLNK
jgi:hypothetical protein